jgi:hypothetical protein
VDRAAGLARHERRSIRLGRLNASVQFLLCSSLEPVFPKENSIPIPQRSTHTSVLRQERADQPADVTALAAPSRAGFSIANGNPETYCAMRNSGHLGKV